MCLMHKLCVCLSVCVCASLGVRVDGIGKGEIVGFETEGGKEKIGEDASSIQTGGCSIDSCVAAVE